MNRSRRVLAAVLSCLPLAASARARELTLAEALSAAESYSPALRSARLQAEAAREGVGVAEAGYYPSLSADGIDSWGFPGSSGYLGIGGVAGSPYRSGAAADLVARDTLFDFGRTYAGVKSARASAELERRREAIDAYSLDADVLRTYYECSRWRSEHEVWDRLHGEIELVAREVARFVDTGQRSIVDRYLSQAQVEEARTNRNYFSSRKGSTVKRLGLLTGLPDADLDCPALPPPGAGVPLSPAKAENPYVREAQARVDVAKDRLFAAKTDYLPKVVGVASVGTMQRVRLVNQEDWSGGLGVIVPLFDGLGTVRAVGRARAELDARTEALGAARLEARELDARYDEVIDASRARLEHLEREETLAREGFSVAKNRYFKFQGTLVDLRDALRNLGRIETDMSDTQASLLEALGAKALLGGAAAAAPAAGGRP